MTKRSWVQTPVPDGCKQFASYYLKEKLKIKVAKKGKKKNNKGYLNETELSPSCISPMFMFALLLLYLCILLFCTCSFLLLISIIFLGFTIKKHFLRFRCQLEQHNSFHSTLDCYYLFSFLIIIFEKANVTLVSIKHKL